MGFQGLAGIRIARTQPRQTDQRSEERHEGLLDAAIVHFRGRPYRVAVINLSTRGTMIESDLVPRLGESVLVEFDQCSRIHAFVRWIRDGRIGLNFGHEIVLEV